MRWRLHQPVLCPNLLWRLPAVSCAILGAPLRFLSGALAITPTCSMPRLNNASPSGYGVVSNAMALTLTGLLPKLAMASPSGYGVLSGAMALTLTGLLPKLAMASPSGYGVLSGALVLTPTCPMPRLTMASSSGSMRHAWRPPGWLRRSRLQRPTIEHPGAGEAGIRWFPNRPLKIRPSLVTTSCAQEIDTRLCL